MKILCLSLALLSLALPLSSRADSLWPTDKTRSMFADRRANAVGDVVTVSIAESTTAVQSADIDMKRTSDTTAGGGTGLWGLLKLAPKATLSGSSTSKGSGSTARNSKLVTTITCRVAELTPTGQLVLKGERTVKVNEDLQTLRFTGIARKEDVLPDNTISSLVVAEAKIEVFGKGPTDRHARPGLLSRVFGLLF